jgi:2-polyprenyl-6-methoxyphenol hydroxylase-like FAD-dependent oxidoreductase
MSERRDVLICGAGPVGLLAAIGLARQGLKVTVVDGEPGVVQSPRATGYFPPTIELLAEFGLYEEVAARAYRSCDLMLHFPLVDDTRIVLSLAVLEGAAKYPFFLSVGQQVLAEIIVEHLGRMPNAEVLWNHRVEALAQDARGVTLSVATPTGTRELHGDWLIGADGARSTVRTLLSLPFEGFTWPDRFVATNLRFDFEKHGFAPNNMIHDPVDWAVVARTGPDDVWRVTFGEDPNLPEADIRRRIPEHYAKILPGDEPYEVVAAAPYRVHERTCPTYRVGRVLLAGDAAHACNPCGGMGLTSGAFDAAALVTALGAVIAGQAGDEVLDFYSQERRRVFLEVASPIAQATKRRITESGAQAQREAVENFTRVRDDPELLRAGMAHSFAVRGRPMLR